jgi:phenylalanyl-tRNA synthetase beta chain
VTYALTMPEREAPLGPPKQGAKQQGKEPQEQEPERKTPLGPTGLKYVCLVNPINPERAVMRHTVLAGVLDVAAENLKNTSDVRLFELGPVYLARPGERLPEEPRRLALVLTGTRLAEFWADSMDAAAVKQPLDFFDLKGVVGGLAADLHLPEVMYRPSPAPYLHPGRAAEVVAAGKSLGHFGELHPKVAQAYDLANRTVLVGELDVEALQAALPPRYAFRPVPRFPAALRDIAVVVAEEVTAERLEAEIRAGGGELLRGVRLFDVYRGESIAPGCKSLAYALTYQADDRTLTDKEIDKAHQKVEGRLKHTLKATVRGKE